MTTAPRLGTEVTTELVPLRRNRTFQFLWAGSAATFVGLFEVEVAAPLILLAITGSALLTSMFAVVQMAANAMAGVPAGILLDRLDRRTVLIATEICRALAMATVVGVQVTHQLTVSCLLIMAAVLGATQPFGTARMLLVRSAVPPQQFNAAVTAEEVRTNAAELCGPPLGGLLVGISQVLPFIVGAAAFAFSSAAALLVRVPRQPEHPVERRTGMFSGLDIVLRDRTMRAAVVVVMLVSAIAWPARLIVIVQLQHRDTPSWEIGAALAGFAVGALLGAAITRGLNRLLRPGVLLLAVGGSQVVVLLALAAPLGPWWDGAACAGYGLGIPAIKVLIDILIVRQVPDVQRGRALNGVFTLFSLVMPIGMLSAGLLLQYFSPSSALLALATVLGLGIALAAVHHSVREAVWPDNVIHQEARPDNP
jgi:MFS family permease